MNSSNSYIRAQSLSYILPDGSTLFSDAQLTISPKTKYGLVGNNGVGKSTLARILAGDLDPSAGNIRRGSSDCIYLPQSEDPSDVTVSVYLEKLWESAVLESHWWQKLLEGIDLEKSINDLSGGQWTRVRILKALCFESNILILDEPTNNLDIENREIIYSFVQAFSGSLLIISHDRNLLKNVDIIFELSPTGITTYGGNYDFYQEESIKQRQHLDKLISSAKKEKRKAQKELQERIQKQEKRNRVGQAKAEKGDLPKILLGRRKDNAQKSLGSVVTNGSESIAQRQKEINDLLLKKEQNPALMLNLPESRVPNGKIIFELNNFNVQVQGEKDFLWSEPLDFLMQGTQHLLIRGANGRGKSTLLKEILGLPTEYLAKRVGGLTASSVPYAFLDQEYSSLKPELSVLDNIQNKSSKDLVEIRNSLALFQFFGEQVHLRTKFLSGGEKMKACLAQILLQDPTPQLIVLDEPTNNLDIESTDILISALRSFEGSLIIISHDQAFLDEIDINRELILN